MKHLIHQLSLFALSIAVTVTLISCGSDSNNGSAIGSDAQGSGTVGILLTDKPADPSLFVAINVAIESIELLGTDENDRISLYSGDTKTFDLLRLRNEAIPFTFQDNIPTGTYCKVRLTLSDLELVLADNTPNDLSDNDTYHPELPGNGKLDLVTRDCFTVGPGEVVTLQLDIDAGNSILIEENNNGFTFRPVVFVDVLNQNFDARLVRLQGKISAIDGEQNTLLLCGAIPSQPMNSMGCVDIYLGETAAFFDNQDYAGAPRSIAELLSTDKVDKQVTVVGWPRYWVKPYVDVDVPKGHYPPPGECKLWNINLEAGQQPPPIHCNDVPAILPVNTVVVTHDGVVKDPYYPLMALDALAVELGDFLQVAGEIATDADATGFTMSVSTGGPIITNDTLSVMLQQGGPGINGTRLVSKSGLLLAPTDLIVPLPVQVDGTLELIIGSDALLKAALVIVDTDMVDTEQVTGTILSIAGDTFTVSPEADVVCGVATVQLSVGLAEDAEILSVTITDTGSEIKPGGNLAIGQVIGMNGRCAPAGSNVDYETDNVVIVDDQR